MYESEITGPAIAWVRFTEGPCDGQQAVLPDLVLVVVVTRDHPDDKWMLHEYFAGDQPEVVANEVGYYRRFGGHEFVHLPAMLAVSYGDGYPLWSLASTSQIAAVP